MVMVMIATARFRYFWCFETMRYVGTRENLVKALTKTCSSHNGLLSRWTRGTSEQSIEACGNKDRVLLSVVRHHSSLHIVEERFLIIGIG